MGLKMHVLLLSLLSALFGWQLLLYGGSIFELAEWKCLSYFGLTFDGLFMKLVVYDGGPRK